MKPASAAASITSYQQGQAILYQNRASEVLLGLAKPDFKPGDPPAMLLVVRNNSPAPFLLAPSSLSVTADGRPVRVYTYEELKTGIDKQASRKSFWNGLAAGMSSMSANSPTTSKTTGSYTIRDNYGNQAGGDYTATTVTDDPAATAARRGEINNQAAATRREIQATNATQIQGLSSILRENTLAPGAVAGGVVKLHPEDLKDAQAVSITVQAGDEAYEFPLEVLK